VTLITTVTAHIPPREAMLAEALASVEAQTHADREVIVVTDVDRRGAWWAKNEGVRQSHGDWITFLDDDDQLLPDHHAHLLACAMETGADVIYPHFYIRGDEWPEPHEDGFAWLFGLPFDEERVRASSTIPGGGSLIRGSLLRELGTPQLGDPEFGPEVYYDDWAMYIRLLNAGAKFVHLAERLYVWRHWGAGNTSGKADRW
jgi:GT2 family glycosyltransferase